MGKLNKFRSIGRICTRIYPDKGGPAKHVYYISKSQNKGGYGNHVISCRNIVSSRNSVEPWIHSIPIRAPLENSNAANHLLFTISYLVLSAFWAIIVFTKFRVTLIHSHSPSIAGISGIIVAKILGLPMVYTVHGLCGPAMPWNGNKGSLIHLIAEEIVIKNSDMIMIVSKDYRQYIKEIAPQSTIISIINGTNPRQFQPARNNMEKELARSTFGLTPSEIAMMWIGNLNMIEKVQGVVDTLEALTLVNDSEDSIRFILVGDGVYTNQILRKIQDFNLETKTKAVGYKRKISFILKAADIFILTSHHEGFPNALLEAMSTGVPCIVSDVGSISEIVGDAALIVSAGNVEEIAVAVEYLANNPIVREELSRRAISRVNELYSWDCAALLQIDAYEKNNF